MKKHVSKYLLLIPALFLILLYAYTFSATKQISDAPKDIATFEECKAAGYPIRESYPETCQTPTGTVYTRVTTNVVPTPITISGNYTCLPKKNTGGAITLECALGLKTKDGYYALDTSAILSDRYPTLTGNESITVEGSLVPIEMISSDRWQTYDVDGIISVEKITIN